jgi:hypothetical protein
LGGPGLYQAIDEMNEPDFFFYAPNGTVLSRLIFSLLNSAETVGEGMEKDTDNWPIIIA